MRDAAGQITSQTNANLEHLLFTYNPAGQILSLQDGKNQLTRWNYDAYGRATNKVDAATNEAFRWSYDADDRLLNRWTPEKGNTAYTYDPMGNLTNVTYPDAVIRYGYDKLNRLHFEGVTVTNHFHDTSEFLIPK